MPAMRSEGISDASHRSMPIQPVVFHPPGREPSWVASIVAQEPGPTNRVPDAKARQDVTWPGLTHAGTVLLPNGWSLKPAGRQSRLGDFPVQIAVHPSEPVLAILHAGYGEHEVVTANADDRQGHRPGRAAGDVRRAWSGRPTASSSMSAAAGTIASIASTTPGACSQTSRCSLIPDLDGEPQGARRAGPVGRRQDAVGRQRPRPLAGPARHDRRARSDDLIPLAADSYPYGLAWDEPRKRLYVSLWNHAAVAVIDTETLKVVGSLPTQEHPNEMLLARGGKILYVANANRNTVSVIDTEAGKAIETIGTAIDPGRSGGKHAERTGALA